MLHDSRDVNFYQWPEMNEKHACDRFLHTTYPSKSPTVYTSFGKIPSFSNLSCLEITVLMNSGKISVSLNLSMLNIWLIQDEIIYIPFGVIWKLIPFSSNSHNLGWTSWSSGVHWNYWTLAVILHQWSLLLNTTLMFFEDCAQWNTLYFSTWAKKTK